MDYTLDHGSRHIPQCNGDLPRQSKHGGHKTYYTDPICASIESTNKVRETLCANKRPLLCVKKRKLSALKQKGKEGTRCDLLIDQPGRDMQG